MPLDNGTYVPLTQSQRQDAQQYFSYVIRAGRTTKAAAIRQAFAKFPRLDQSDKGSLNYNYGVAKDEVDAAVALRRTWNRTPLPSEIGPVSDEPRRKGLYRYELLITVTDPTTGKVYTGRDFLWTADPMSLKNVRANVEANRQYYLQRVGSPQVPAGIQDDVTITTAVLSLGRVA